MTNPNPPPPPPPPPKKLAVIGDPIAHSLSPIIHQHWLHHHHLPFTYEKIQITPPQLDNFLMELKKDFVGINITLPHKYAAYQFAQKHNWQIEAPAHHAQSINWVAAKKNNGKDAIRAGSSDGEGFVQHLIAQAPDWTPSLTTTLIGAGGAAAALATTLAQKNIQQLNIVNRTHAHAQQLAKMIQNNFSITPNIFLWEERQKPLQQTQLLIQTTSLGMKGQPPLTLDLSPLPDNAIVADIVYQPLKTNLLRAAEKKGLVIVDGLGMLIQQARIAFHQWFGFSPDSDNQLIQKLEKLFV